MVVMKIYWHDGSKNIIGPRVRQARDNAPKPITQQDLSAKLGVMGIIIDRVSISKIESGDRFVPDYEVVAIAKALNVTLEWLLTGK
jgi:transcriptional regulator with XRE-family HTH domain